MSASKMRVFVSKVQDVILVTSLPSINAYRCVLTGPRIMELVVPIWMK